MNTKKTKRVKRVKFWSRIRHDHHDEWTLVEGTDRSRVPVKAWKALNKIFWQWKSNGLLFPSDELEAYQYAASQLIKASKNVGDLRRAGPVTYLVRTAVFALMKYRSRKVQPLRDEYGASAAVTDDVSAFVESLPGIHSFEGVNASQQAKQCVDETLAKLEPEAQRGLRCWLQADGIWVDAAKLYGCSRSWYLAMFKHRWAPAFRNACTWRW